MISLEKIMILTTLQKCRRFGQINYYQRFWKVAQSPIIAQFCHTGFESRLDNGHIVVF